ncbi:solute carrier family 2, facilitated glucose transporter member 4-like [Amphiura filiformis]|uniref:solute carrier family 2, facilitated glucose transporter member 4-like n=1 Tax=Amphiura filiformis TaxID=82378 RepID=UPI003B224CC1
MAGDTESFTFTVMPFYLAEISPINLRGSIGVFSSLCRALGSLIAHILGFAFFYSQTKWPIQLSLTACFAVINLILFPFCPESPRWLFITQNRREDGIKALQLLRGHDTDISAEIEEMKAEYLKSIQVSGNQTIDTLQILKFKRPEWKMALILGSVVQMGIQFSGFSSVMMYTTDIYESAGLGMREIAYATVGLSSLNVVMTGVSVSCL